MVHTSAESGYHEQSEVYSRVRPGYHADLVGRFTERYGEGVVAELGAGTGIFTRQLTDAGLAPIAIEPVAAMRQALSDAQPRVRVIDGTAESTGLGDNSVATVVVAQAFHWFDHPRALAEIERIVEPGGHLVCAWNVRDESVDWVNRWTEIVDRHAGDTPRYRDMAWRRAIDSDARFGLVDEWSIPNPVPATPDTAVGRALSTSFIAALDPETQRAVLDEIRTLAESVGESFDFPYRSELQAWKAA